MKLVITIKQFPGRRPRVIESKISPDVTLAQMRQVVEAEQFLNTIPGTDLRWHMNIVEEDTHEDG